MNYTLGVDVSDFQGRVDWRKVARAGYRFCFLKATEGVGYAASSFAVNRRDSKNAGLVFGAYHFFRSGQDPVAQAEHFCAVIGDLGDTMLPPCLDVEEFRRDPQTMGKMVRAWLQFVRQRYGRLPIVYCSPGTFDPGVSGDDFGGFPLWVANYTRAPQPVVPTDWDHWDFWQYSSTGRVPGIVGNVDLDRFPGTPADLTAWIAKNAASQ